MIFGRKILPSTSGVFAIRVVTRGVDVCVDVGDKHSCSKQYLKEGRALRIETVVNDPTDLGVLRRLVHLPELPATACEVNRRLLDHEQVGQGCVLASPVFERIARPSLVDERRAPALRFGDPRVVGLAGALAVTAHLVGGFSNNTRRPLVAGLLGEHYRRASLLRPARAAAEGTDRPAAAFQHLHPHRGRATLRDLYTKLRDRLLRPLLAADQPPAPLQVRQALRVLDQAVTDYIHQARIAA